MKTVAQAGQESPGGSWKKIVLKYQRPSAVRATWQLINSLGGYIAIWGLIYLSRPISLWLTAALVILAGGFLVRVFIIFHDCGHGSFLKSGWANDLLGFVTGVLTFTPYALWRKEHARHHSTAADLDRRGVGDVPTMTVEEYLAAPLWKQLGYRLIRNPVVLFGIGPLVMFLVKHRFTLSKSAAADERSSVLWTNIAVLGMVAAMGMAFGLLPYLILQTGVMAVAGTAGTWLFYVQHQFDGVYWERQENWDFLDAAMKGSSFYKLPKILQWFSGNIGYHHIHHLSPRIPNYNLERCHNAEPLFQNVPPVTVLSSLKAMTYRLWDEQSKRLVGFSHLRGERRHG
jgi:acyl-lipid omega-6 desaturase (Delta-12 desaturase)